MLLLLPLPFPLHSINLESRNCIAAKTKSLGTSDEMIGSLVYNVEESRGCTFCLFGWEGRRIMMRRRRRAGFMLDSRKRQRGRTFFSYDFYYFMFFDL